MGKPIRILCVFGKLSRGGAESMCMNLYRKINREKIQFDFVKHTADIGEFEQEIHQLGGKIFEAPRFRGFNIIQYIRWWKKHYKKHPEYQIVHGHFFITSPIYFYVAHKYNVITIGHSHSTKSKYKGFNIIRYSKELLNKFVEKMSDHCLACSQEAGEYLFPHKNFTVLNNAIETSKFAFSLEKSIFMRNQFGIDNNCFVIGTVASFSKVKNPNFIIDIIQKLSIQDINFKFLWVGDGYLKKEIQQKINDLHLNKYVIFTGSRADIYDIMQAMDVFILPSLFEGLPVVSIEAQTSGLPTLLSENVSIEAKKTDLCSYLPINDASIWVDKILELKQTFIRKDYSQQIVDNNYDIETTKNWLEDFYTKIIEERNLNNE